MKHFFFVFSVLALFLLSGCNSYHTDTSLGFKSTELGASPYAVEIIRGNIDSSNYLVLGPVSGRVNKTTIFDKNPTTEQADEVLKLKASKLGADALIEVSYETGLFGLIQASGVAIKRK